MDDESMDVEGAVASFSQLHLQPDDAMMNDIDFVQQDEMTSAPSVPFPILHLPAVLTYHILSYLPVLDRLAFASTCRQLHHYRLTAYSVITLQSASFARLLSSAEQLVRVLQQAPDYATVTKKLVVSCTDNYLQTANRAAYTLCIAKLDLAILQLLTFMPGLAALAINFTGIMCYAPFPYTLTHAVTMQHIRDLQLFALQLPTYEGRNIAVPDERRYAPAFENVVLDISCGDWLQYLFADPSHLRRLAIRVQKPDNVCGRVLQTLAKAAAQLETLIMTTLPQRFTLNVDAYSQIMAHGFTSGVFDNLREFSLDAAIAPTVLERFFRAFTSSRVTRLRLVVNHHGVWLPDFSPQYINMLAHLVPNLEELVLDQRGMTEADPLPGGNLNDWAAAIRHIPNLRLLALASMFVLNVYGPCSYDSDESDEEDHGDGSESDCGRSEWSFCRNVISLAAWADELMDEYLRIVRPFEELWLLGVQTPRGFPPEQSVSGGGVGFKQHVHEEEEDGVRRRRFIIRPAARDGWWWENSSEKGH